MATLIKVVDQNACKIRIVLMTKLVLTINAWILVLKSAVRTQNALWSIISLLAVVWKIMKETHLTSANLSEVSGTIYIDWSQRKTKFQMLIYWCSICYFTIERTKPCEPSPCGPNSICREFNEQASCTCLPGYFGIPPSCRPECLVNSDCEQSKACMNQRCQNPCDNTCGQNALCIVRNHNPICSCPVQYSGDPFVSCFPMSK